jgi:lysophospholipase L1-like esterase
MLPVIAPPPTPSSLRLPAALGSGLDTTLLARWRAAKGRVRAGASDALVGLIGDSTTAGQGAGAGASYTNGAKALSVPSRLAGQLAAMGLRAASDSVFGNANIDSFTRSNANYVAYNPQVAMAADWTIENFPIPGGNFFRNTAGTGAWSFTPSEAFDTIDLYFLNATGNGQVTVDVGGAVLATIDTGVTSGGATAVVKMTVGTGAAAALGTMNVKRSGTGGLVRLFGVVTRNSAIGKVNVVNLGAAGWASVDWAPANPGVWAPNRALQTLAFDLVLINVGLNDTTASRLTTPAAYQANIQSLIGYAKAGGSDVILVIPPPQDPATRDTTNLMPGHAAALNALAAQNGCNVIDLAARFGGYAQTSAAGNYRDNVHMLAHGYADIADAYARTLFGA